MLFPPSIIHMNMTFWTKDYDDVRSNELYNLVLYSYYLLRRYEKRKWDIIRSREKVHRLNKDIQFRREKHIFIRVVLIKLRSQISISKTNLSWKRLFNVWFIRAVEKCSYQINDEKLMSQFKPTVSYISPIFAIFISIHFTVKLLRMKNSYVSANYISKWRLIWKLRSLMKSML